MPYKEKPITKLYYNISEVAQLFGCETSKIRFYERHFKLRIARNCHGTRKYTADVIKELQDYIYLTSVVLLTLKGAKQWLDLGWPLTEVPNEVLINPKTKYA